jgi:hypothetical protein
MEARMMQIKFAGMTVTLDVDDECAWRILRFAAGQAGQTFSDNPSIGVVGKVPTRIPGR